MKRRNFNKLLAGALAAAVTGVTFGSSPIAESLLSTREYRTDDLWLKMREENDYFDKYTGVGLGFKKDGQWYRNGILINEEDPKKLIDQAVNSLFRWARENGLDR